MDLQQGPGKPVDLKILGLLPQELVPAEQKGKKVKSFVRGSWDWLTMVGGSLSFS